MAEVAEQAPLEPRARNVLYCGVCSLPPEYCEFGESKVKCQEWLQANHPDFYSKLYSAEAISRNLAALSVDAQEREKSAAAKQEAKEKLIESRVEEKKATSKVRIHRIERNRRKHVTVVSGLEAFGLENKKVAKEMGKKFATGSSVTKSAAGAQEITVQGDLCFDIQEWLETAYEQISEDRVEIVDEKKKKKPAS